MLLLDSRSYDLPLAANAPLNRGLLGWWRASGVGNKGYFRDLMNRSGRIGTDVPLINAATWVAGRSASTRALRCDGSERGARITCPTYLRLARPLHISGWLRSNGTSPSNYAGLFGISYTNSDSVPYESFTLGNSDAGYLRGYSNNSGLVWLNASSYAISSFTNWTHVAFEVSGTNGYIYVNGIQVASGYSSGSSFADPTYGTAQLTIGASTPGTSRNINCDIDDVRIANRYYGEDGIKQLYHASRRGWQQELARPRRYWFPAASASLFTATGALSVGHATAAGSATFTAPVYTATAALTLGAATASGSGTFSPGTKTASGALAVGPATAAGTATQTPPVYTGTSALAAGSAALAASGTVTSPVYTASGALSAGPATAAASATFAPGTKTATATLTTGPAAAAASGTFSPGTKTASGALAVGPATAAASATATNPTYTASGALTLGPATCAGSALFASVVYQASGALSAGPAAASGSATFSSPVYTASGALAAGHAAAAASATFTAPVYTGSGALTAGHATAAGTATFTSPTYTASGTVTVGRATCAASATHTRPTYSASGTLTCGHASAAGSALFSTQLNTATAALAVGAPLLSGIARLVLGETFAGAVTITRIGVAARPERFGLCVSAERASA